MSKEEDLTVNESLVGAGTGQGQGQGRGMIVLFSRFGAKEGRGHPATWSGGNPGGAIGSCRDPTSFG